MNDELKACCLQFIVHRSSFIVLWYPYPVKLPLTI
jgi:hypothetical protein